MKKTNIVINRNSKTTIIFIQGGPINWLVADPSLALKDVPVGLTGYYWSVKNLIDKAFKDFNFVQVKQVQNLRELDPISIEQALEYQKENISYIYDAVQEYKKLGHKVILFGHSYGGFILNEYIAVYGMNADYAVIANARLDMPIEVPIAIDTKQVMPFFGDDNTLIESEPLNDSIGLKKLRAVLEYSPYSCKLATQNLSKVIFVTCVGDKWMGTFNDGELEFIKNKKAHLIKNTIEDAKAIVKESGASITYREVAHNTVFHKSVYKQILEITK